MSADRALEAQWRREQREKTQRVHVRPRVAMWVHTWFGDFKV